jgi:hypothetical protein
MKAYSSSTKILLSKRGLRSNQGAALYKRGARGAARLRAAAKSGPLRLDFGSTRPKLIQNKHWVQP